MKQATVFQDAMATCHPERRVYRWRDQKCLECVIDERHAKRNGYTRINPSSPVLPGVRQKLVQVIPERCEKCGNRFLIVAGRRISCPGVRGGCGENWFLVE